MKNLNFSDSDLEKIGQAVKEAESETSGEIKVAFIRESYDYAKYELFFALIAGFLSLGVIVLFPGKIEHFIKNMFWEYSPVYTAVFFGIFPFIIITIFYLFANLRFLDRIIIPGSVMRKKVHERAIRYFTESGIFNTRDRTGILIFLSFLERRVELIADKGISSKIPQERWDGIVKNITDGIKSGDTVGKLIDSVRECGVILSEADKFPIKPDDENELEDDVSVLES